MSTGAAPEDIDPAAPDAAAETPEADKQAEFRPDWKWLRTVPPAAPTPAETDPFSESFVRDDIGETAGTIHYFWFGKAVDDPAALHDRQALWFQKSFDTDAMIAARFTEVLARLASGEAWRWARKSPRDRLSAIIALDQFTRNIFRGSATAFENDALALALTHEALARGEAAALKPVERWFLYMPLEHSENASDQKRSTTRFAQLLEEAPPALRPAFASASDYAKRHADVIRRFGRFPHRNEALGRVTTSAEKAFLKKPGSRF